MPTGKDPWPAIKERVQASYSAQQVAPSPKSVLSESPQPGVGLTILLRGTRRFRVSMATAMVGLLAFAAGGFALLTWNGTQPNPGTELAPGCWGLVSSPNIEGGDTVL